MKLGTKSVLFGAHCFFIHPLFLALAWWKLYSFPFDPRLWIAFFVHDLGYLGCENMDDDKGEQHPYLGASIMKGFDRSRPDLNRGTAPGDLLWHDFTLYHSRFLSKRHDRLPSRLCCLLYTSPSPRDATLSRMPSSA